MQQQNEHGESSPSVFSYGDKQLRTIHLNGEMWFIGRDITDVLEMSNPSECFKKLDDDERLVSEVLIPGRSQIRTYILVNESGLYHLIFRSLKPEAQDFRRWVTQEVLPTIRKTGTYAGHKKDSLPKDLAGRQLSLWPSEQIDRSKLQDLMVDVALQAKPSSKVGQLIRLIKPLLQSKSVEA